jgi:hypothetical protein
MGAASSLARPSTGSRYSRKPPSAAIVFADVFRYLITFITFNGGLQFYRILIGPTPAATTHAKGDAPKMPVRFRHLAAVAALTLLASGLSGCGTINEKLADGMGDYVPQWMGGLPADAPPRPGTAKYDEYMKERERKRLEPAVKDDAANPTTSSNPTTSPSGLGAVH